MELKFLCSILYGPWENQVIVQLLSMKAAGKLYFFHSKPFLSRKHKLYCHLNKYYVLECLLLDSKNWYTLWLILLIFICVNGVD